MYTQPFIAAIVMSLFLSGGAPGCRTKPVSGPQVKHTSPQRDDKMTQMNVLIEGFQSSITKPFVAVIRDSETYSVLTKLERNLPALGKEFFESHVVIAAFLGERNTGGYTVQIEEAPGAIRITESKPGKGMMVPQMITTPFKVVSIERNVSSSVVLAIGETWTAAAQTYNAQGNFSASGGFAGIREEFSIGGRIRVTRLNNLATFAFDLSSPYEKRRCRLAEFATAISENDRAEIAKMSADLLVMQPNSGLKATAVFHDAEKRFSVTFEPLPATVADGYSGQGSIEATVAK